MPKQSELCYTKEKFIVSEKSRRLKSAVSFARKRKIQNCKCYASANTYLLHLLTFGAKNGKFALCDSMELKKYSLHFCAFSIRQPRSIYNKNRNFFFLGRAGFEPAKAKPTDLQSAPINHSGTDPWGGRTRTSEWRDQNPQPYHLATPHV